MSEDPSGWSLTESDPQVFTQLLRDLGVKGLQVVSRQTFPHASLPFTWGPLARSRERAVYTCRS